MASKSNYAMKMNGIDPDKHKLIAGFLEGGINEIPTATVEFVSRDRLLKLEDFVGIDMGFSVTGLDDKEQLFWGTCITAENKGSPSGDGHYVVELKPWLWHLTRTQENRIFQNMKTTAIVQEILGDYGFSGDLKTQHSNAEPERLYCVQYRETDFDFIKRLLEEDGIYFYFEFEESAVKMVLADSAGTHAAVKIDDQLPFRADEAEQQLDHIYKWESYENVVSGKVTLDDYDFTKPKADLTSKSVIGSGSHAHKSYEMYSYPGRHYETSLGDKFADYQMEAAAAEHQIWHGEGNILNMWVGQTFDLIDHPRHTSAAMQKFMVRKAKQFFRLELEDVKDFRSVLEGSVDFGLSAFEHSRIIFESVLKSTPFRMPRMIPRPIIAGVHTAVVTGGIWR